VGRDNRIYMEVSALPENVGIVRMAVAALAAQAPFTVPDVEEIKVAVSEAVTNAIRHGYKAGPGRVRISAALDDAVLEVLVEDEGVGMEDVAEARRAAASGEDPERLGLGFTFMESLMDGVEVESAPGRGTRVRMWKAIPREGAQGPVRDGPRG